MTAGASAAGWPAVLREPAAFADGPAAAAWFDRVAATLLNRVELCVAGRPHRLIEVEVYDHSPAHPDPFAHRDPVQVHTGRWYFHRSHGVYRGGSFKGLDLTFGRPGAFAGVLLRGLELPDGTVVDGPSLLVDHVLKTAGSATVRELDETLGPALAWDPAQPLSLVAANKPVDRPVLRTARVGLTWKRFRPRRGDPAATFVLRPYRYLTEPRRTAKGKPQQVLALLAAGEAPDAIRDRTRCPLPTIERYAAEYEAGKHESDLAPYAGRDWSAKDLARLHGLLRVGHSLRE